MGSTGSKKLSVHQAPGIHKDGLPEYKIITLSNENGMVVTLTNYGCTLLTVCVPDQDGEMDNVLCGHLQVEQCMSGAPNFNSIVGPCANRIANASFTLKDPGSETKDTCYTLEVNNGPNHLHGGKTGLFGKIFDVHTKLESGEVGHAIVTLSYTAEKEEGCYPGGPVTYKVQYMLNNHNELHLTMTATTEKRTIINLTHHAYWNLDGNCTGNTVLDHMLEIRAPYYTPFNDDLIPTGQIKSVDGTALDFQQPRVIREGIDTLVSPQLEEVNKAYPDLTPFTYGLDHNFVLEHKASAEAELVAILSSKQSGRVMTLYSNQPGLQVYTGNFLQGRRDQAGYKQHSAICLEPQKFPDSINQYQKPGWLERETCPILEVGETYTHHMAWKFSVDDTK